MTRKSLFVASEDALWNALFAAVESGPGLQGIQERRANGNSSGKTHEEMHLS